MTTPKNWRETGVIDTSQSPKAKLHGAPIHAVTMRDGFWKPWLDRNLALGLPRLHRHLEDHGVVDNFRRMTGRKSCPRQGPFFTDSDLFKWMEGAAWALQGDAPKDLGPLLESVIDEVVAAQCPDGYLNTFFVDELAGQRFRNLPIEHELYCAGHYFQAAVAHFRSTGGDKLLRSAQRYADYLVEAFGPGERQGVDGHEEVELALVELYRVTGRQEYLKLAGFFLDQLGVVGQREVRGHAVRAMYRACGVADYYAETGQEAYGEAARAMWSDMVNGKIYLTGGLGARQAGEAFGEPYELPNTRAYAETCAALGGIFFNWRMLAVEGQAQYADLMERMLYNGFLSGVSLSGQEYFYVNPLASPGGHLRRAWYDCTCCPTNAVRAFATLPGYVFSLSTEGVWVHLYDNATLNGQLEHGPQVKLEQRTNYPWQGEIEILVEVAEPVEFTLFLRLPGWCEKGELLVNDRSAGVDFTPGAYAAIRRTWHKGDRAQLRLDLPVTPMTSHPRVAENRGCAALMRGPLVYCLESVDNPDINLADTLVNPSAGFLTKTGSDLLAGMVTVTTQGMHQPAEGPLYAQLGARRTDPGQPVTLTAIPYFAWSNRGDSQMQVWTPVIRSMQQLL